MTHELLFPSLVQLLCVSFHPTFVCWFQPLCSLCSRPFFYSCCIPSPLPLPPSLHVCDRHIAAAGYHVCPGAGATSAVGRWRRTARESGVERGAQGPLLCRPRRCVPVSDTAFPRFPLGAELPFSRLACVFVSARGQRIAPMMGTLDSRERAMPQQ